MDFAREWQVTKALVIGYKQALMEESYAVRSINSMIASVNSLLEFLGWTDCKTKFFKVQRQSFCSAERELTKDEYVRLVKTARKKENERLALLLQTICGTGIRVRELQFITVEGVRAGVDARKVFPHNLRHLFAWCFYGIEKDIAKLADILGHSSINTTWIYIVTTEAEHRK